MKNARQNPKEESTRLSPLVEKLLLDVYMFHWRTTAVVLPAAIVVLGWFAKDIIENPNYNVAIEAKKPISYLLLVGVVLLSITLIWRTFTSVTLWRLNCIAEKFDPQYGKFAHDKKRMGYNSLAAVSVELPLFCYNILVLYYYGADAYLSKCCLWTILYFGAFFMCGISAGAWLKRHLQIMAWHKAGAKNGE